MPILVGSRLICALIGYLFGSILTAELVARHRTGHSAAQIGTGNPGMANILTHLGKGAGAAVLAGDALKTLVACLAASRLAGAELGSIAVLYAGLGAILGHNFPLWARGKGGKGVTVTCVWLMLYLGFFGIACCAAGGAVVLLTGYLPLGAVIIPVLAMPFAMAAGGTEGALAVAAAALLMLSRHYRGLIRIAKGAEPRYFRKNAK